MSSTEYRLHRCDVCACPMMIFECMDVATCPECGSKIRRNPIFGWMTLDFRKPDPWRIQARERRKEAERERKARDSAV